MTRIMVEYLWIDGTKPTSKLRSKTKILDKPVKKISDIPEWNFDGSSTQQATGDKSGCILRPVNFIIDPIRGGQNIIVMCEVYKADGSIHPSNTRSKLVKLATKYKSQEAWFGIEQEYTMLQGMRPLGWPENGYPAPQGPYYCGVGADEVFGREIVEDHM